MGVNLVVARREFRYINLVAVSLSIFLALKFFLSYIDQETVLAEIVFLLFVLMSLQAVPTRAWRTVFTVETPPVIFLGLVASIGLGLRNPLIYVAFSLTESAGIVVGVDLLGRNKLVYYLTLYFLLMTTPYYYISPQLLIACSTIYLIKVLSALTQMRALRIAFSIDVFVRPVLAAMLYGL